MLDGLRRGLAQPPDVPARQGDEQHRRGGDDGGVALRRSSTPISPDDVAGPSSATTRPSRSTRAVPPRWLGHRRRSRPPARAPCGLHGDLRRELGDVAQLVVGETGEHGGSSAGGLGPWRATLPHRPVSVGPRTFEGRSDERPSAAVALLAAVRRRVGASRFALRLGAGRLVALLLARGPPAQPAGTFLGSTTVSDTSGSSSPSGRASTITVAPGGSSARSTKSASGSSM